MITGVGNDEGATSEDNVTVAYQVTYEYTNIGFL